MYNYSFFKKKNKIFSENKKTRISPSFFYVIVDWYQIRADGIRTHDQWLKRPLLYRLSYRPITLCNPTKAGKQRYIWVLDKSFEFFVYFRRYLNSHWRTVFKLNLFVDQVWLECSFASTHWVRSSISWFSSLTCEVTYSCHQSKENI